MSTSASHRPKRYSAIAVVPVLAFALIGGAFYWGLFNTDNTLPSTLIGKPVPEFTLPPIEGRSDGFSTEDLKGQAALINIFASWCVPCRAEHPVISELARNRVVPIYGINYKDKASDVVAWLQELGDPYTRIGADTVGRVAIDFGAYGVPETYVVAADGTIAYRVVGPITQTILDRTLLPLIRRLQSDRDKGG